MLISADILAALTALLKPEQRSAAAQKLAHLLGGEDLIIFLKDQQLDLFLPAPGFPQTLPGGRSWQMFVKSCVAAGIATVELRSPATGNLISATGIARDDQVIVVLGLSEPHATLQQVAALLPLVGAALQGEQHAHTAAGQVAIARETALRATALAETLDQTRRALQEALSQAEVVLRTRDEFLSLAAHELKTPVSALQGYLQLVQRRFAKDYPLSPRDSRTLQTLVEQVRRLTRLIGSLFDLSRMQTGRLSLECQSVDVVALMERIVEEITPSLDQHRLAFTAQQPSIMIEGDIIRLEQVLYNLILNAIKYSPEGGTVRLEILVEDEEVCIRVSDEGIGIPQQAIPHLFTQFYRAENARSQLITGMGIGLYVVKEIIAAHMGRISVDSVEGQGTTFTICMPTTVTALVSS